MTQASVFLRTSSATSSVVEIAQDCGSPARPRARRAPACAASHRDARSRSPGPGGCRTAVCKRTMRRPDARAMQPVGPALADRVELDPLHDARRRAEVAGFAWRRGSRPRAPAIAAAPADRPRHAAAGGAPAPRPPRPSRGRSASAGRRSRAGHRRRSPPSSASKSASTLRSSLSSPLAARGMMPAPMMLLTSTDTALAACGLLRTRSRIRSRSSAPATPISVSAEDPGARQPSVRRPRPRRHSRASGSRRPGAPARGAPPCAAPPWRWPGRARSPTSAIPAREAREARRPAAAASCPRWRARWCGCAPADPRPSRSRRTCRHS